MTAGQAETYAREAAFQSANAQPSNMHANSLYEKAIQTYRDIPGKWRPTYQVDERIAELRRQQSQAGEQVLDEMGVIRSPGIDISEFVEQARKAVSGKQPIEALRGLANIHPGERAGALRDRVIERIKEFPLQWMFDSTMFSRDGRVIAKRPALNLLATEISESDERAIQAAMVRIPRHSDTQPTLIRTPVPRSFGQAVGAQRRRGGIVSPGWLASSISASVCALIHPSD